MEPHSGGMSEVQNLSTKLRGQLYSQLPNYGSMKTDASECRQRETQAIFGNCPLFFSLFETEVTDFHLVYVTVNQKQI